MSKIEAQHIKRLVSFERLVSFVVVGLVLFVLYEMYHLYAKNDLHRSFHRANVEHVHLMIDIDEKEKSEEDHLNAVNQLHQSLHLSRTDHEHEDDKFP